MPALDVPNALTAQFTKHERTHTYVYVQNTAQWP